MEIVPLDRKYLGEIVDIHMDSLREAFSTYLGRKFVEKIFYSEILNSERGFGFVCLDENKVVGYIVGARDSNKSTKKYLCNNLFFAIFPVIYKIMKNPRAISKFIKVLKAIKTCNETDIESRIVSIAVKRNYRNRGIGKTLVNRFKEHLKEKDLNGCWVRTSSNAACRMYKKSGFDCKKTFIFEGRKYFIYTYKID